MKIKPVFPSVDWQIKASSALYNLGKFDPRDMDRWQRHGDLVGRFVRHIFPSANFA